MRFRLRILGGALLLAALAAGCRSATEAPWRQPDVIVISIDTLRADHLPTYGYARPTAPRIDELARSALVFERAYSEAPHTLPAHTSLFTGLYPGRHGVLDRGDTLAPSVPTLAEILAAHGYQTAGFTSCYFLTPEFRVDRGFAHYEFANDIENPRAADETNRAILAWVDGLKAGAPFFLFAHYFDVHSDWHTLPYDAPDAFRRRFAGDPPAGFRTGDGSVSATRWLTLQNRKGSDLTPEELRYIESLYDAGIAWTDSQVGALLDALAERGRLDHAIVIVLADHGEEFEEHGKMLHTQVFAEQLHVPLIVSLPEMRGASSPACQPRPGLAAARAGRTRALAQHVDLLPTIADCLGIPIPPGVQGQSLLPVFGGGPGPRQAAYFDTPRGNQTGILRDDWKLVETPASGRRRLYRVDRDPGEKADVSASEPARTEALAAELAEHRRANAAGRVEGANVAVPESVHKALESLGYVREDKAP